MWSFVIGRDVSVERLQATQWVASTINVVLYLSTHYPLTPNL
jgi:hypothetical protein